MRKIWKDSGLIYEPTFDGSWKDNSALTPTPIIINNEEIRIFCGFRDPKGVSRIGYIDVDINNPKKIIRVSKVPVLDIGIHGTFDDNGLILGDIIEVENKIYMFYVGFQLVDKVKFLAFSGLAISEDRGETFNRISNTPILDRSDEAIYIRAIHSVIFEDGIWKIWYSTGSSWQKIDQKLFPCYDIKYLETSDITNIYKIGVNCILNDKNNLEYRIGRPRVYKHDNEYIMNFTYGTLDGKYQVGQACSIDGLKWKREDDLFNLKPGECEWNSKHLCYPAYLKTDKSEFVFYNGNNMGFNGFGYAINTIK